MCDFLAGFIPSFTLRAVRSWCPVECVCVVGQCVVVILWLCVHAASDVVVLVLGDSHASCGETRDRVSLDLAGSQQLLLQHVLNATGNLANSPLPPDWASVGLNAYTRPGGPIPVVTVLIHCRPITFDSSRGNWLQPGLPTTGASALLTAWQPSEQGGPAIVDVITGRVNPSGHLTQAWLRSAGHVKSPSGNLTSRACVCCVYASGKGLVKRGTHVCASGCGWMCLCACR